MYSMRHTDGGKSDRQRPGSTQKFLDNWELIYGKKCPEEKADAIEECIGKLTDEKLQTLSD